MEWRMPIFKGITPTYEEVLGWQPRLFPFKSKNYANVCIDRFPPEVVSHRHAILAKTICLKKGRGPFAWKSTSPKLFSPDVSRFAHVYLSFFKPEKRNMLAKTWLHMWINNFFHWKLIPKYIKHLRPSENNFGRIERAQFPTNPAVWINSEKNWLREIRDWLKASVSNRF